MHPRHELIQQLTSIETDALGTTNPYKLSIEEAHDLRIVLNTLKQIMEKMDELANRRGSARGVVFLEPVAPIHLENYRDYKHNKEGDAKLVEAQLTNSLVNLFIKCFSIVKNAGNEQVRHFCQRLSGVCIDARTEQAFNYALTLERTPAFTELLQKSFRSLNPRDQNYFKCFSTLLNEKTWGEPFQKDEGPRGFCKKNGLLNSDCFELISNFLKDVLFLEPGDDFFTAYQCIDPIYLPILIRFLFYHPHLLDRLSLPEEVNPQPEAKAATFPGVIYHFVFSEFVKNLDWRLLCPPSTFPLLYSLANRAPVEICYEGLAKLDLKAHAEQHRKLSDLCVKKLLLCKNTLPDLVKKQVEEAIQFPLHRAMVSNSKESVKSLILLNANHTIRWHHATPATLAAKHKAWGALEQLVELKEDSDGRAGYWNALVAAIEDNQTALAHKILTAGEKNSGFFSYVDRKNNDALNYAIMHNHIPLASTILHKAKNQNSKATPAVIIAAMESTIRPETFSWLLSQEGINPDARNKVLTPFGVILLAIHQQNDPDAILKLRCLLPYIDKIDTRPLFDFVDCPKPAKEILNLYHKPDIQIRLARQHLQYGNFKIAEQVISTLCVRTNDPTYFDQVIERARCPSRVIQELTLVFIGNNYNWLIDSHARFFSNLLLTLSDNDINTTLKGKKTLLQIAIKKNKPELIQNLLKRGAKISKHTPIYDLAKSKMNWELLDKFDAISQHLETTVPPILPVPLGAPLQVLNTPDFKLGQYQKLFDLFQQVEILAQRMHPDDPLFFTALMFRDVLRYSEFKGLIAAEYFITSQEIKNNTPHNERIKVQVKEIIEQSHKILNDCLSQARTKLQLAELKALNLKEVPRTILLHFSKNDALDKVARDLSKKAEGMVPIVTQSPFFKEFEKQQSMQWPHAPEILRTIERAGFSFKPNIIERDRCVCESCGVVVSGWQPWHNPWLFHTSTMPHPFPISVIENRFRLNVL